MDQIPKQSRNWCFTSFEQFDWQTIYNEHNFIRYMCVGTEICPTTGKMHWQGWVQFKSLKRMNGVKALFNSEIHVEPKKWTTDNIDSYCKKDGDYQVFGDFITQGQRKDLTQMAALIDGGASKAKIMKTDPATYLQYRNGFNDMLKARDLEKSKEFRDISIVLLFGGLENDRTVFAMTSNEDIYRQDMRNMSRKKLLWDDYNGEKILFLDNYNLDIGITPISNLLSGFSTRLNTKGSHTFAQWTKIIISFDYHLDMDPNARNKVFSFNFFEFAKPGMEIKKYRKDGKWMTRYIKKKAEIDRLILFFSLVKGAYLWDVAYDVNVDINWETFTCDFYRLDTENYMNNCARMEHTNYGINWDNNDCGIIKEEQEEIKFENEIKRFNFEMNNPDEYEKKIEKEMRIEHFKNVPESEDGCNENEAKSSNIDPLSGKKCAVENEIKIENEIQIEHFKNAPESEDGCNENDANSSNFDTLDAKKKCAECGNLRYKYEFDIAPNACISCLNCEHGIKVGKCSNCRKFAINYTLAMKILPKYN